MSEIIIKSTKQIFPNFSEIWHYRFLVYALIMRNIKLRYKQTILGILWVVIQPLALSGVFIVVFGNILPMATSKGTYSAFVIIGVLVWQFFNRALTDASASVLSFSGIISKVYFPRILVPISSVLTALFDFVIIFPLILILLLKINGSIPLHAIWALPCFLIITLSLVIGLSLCLSSLNALFRDIQHAIPFVLQLTLYLSPIIYPLSILPEKWLILYKFNPLVALVDGFRWSLVPLIPAPDHFSLLVSFGMSLGALIFGSVLFSSLEHRMIDKI